MVFGILNVLETFFGFIFWIIPYWDWVRMGFFIWLLLPNFNGAKIIYESGIKPFMETNKDIIHEWINKLKNVASDAADEAKKAASDINGSVRTAFWHKARFKRSIGAIPSFSTIFREDQLTAP